MCHLLPEVLVCTTRHPYKHPFGVPELRALVPRGESGYQGAVGLLKQFQMKYLSASKASWQQGGHVLCQKLLLSKRGEWEM